MDTFNANLRSALTNGLAIQKELAAFNESQLKLAQGQIVANFELYRNALSASQSAANAMTKVWTDALKVEATA